MKPSVVASAVALAIATPVAWSGAAWAQEGPASVAPPVQTWSTPSATTVITTTSPATVTTTPPTPPAPPATKAPTTNAAVPTTTSADIDTAAPPEPPLLGPEATAEETIVGPNYELLTAGFATLGVAYVPSVVVAAESHRLGDTNLYLPVFGPWFDLLARSPCPVGEPRCGPQTAPKLGLVADGVLQTAGAVQLGLALFLPHKKILLHALGGSASIDVTPASIGHGAYGLMGTGKF